MARRPIASSVSVARIAAIARALGDLSGRMVFIGGAIAPLLQTNPVIPKVRATDDVDAIVATTTYAEAGELADRLRERQFRQDIADATHAHRWRAPDGTPFDVVPTGEHMGGTGSQFDTMAIETAVEAEIDAGLIIRHASAAGFLALKWAAFWDRGAEDPFESHDLEDILALMVSRDAIVDEVKHAPPKMRNAVRRGFQWLAESRDYDDLLAAHLGNARPYQGIASLLRQRVNDVMDATGEKDRRGGLTEL